MYDKVSCLLETEALDLHPSSNLIISSKADIIDKGSLSLIHLIISPKGDTNDKANLVRMQGSPTISHEEGADQPYCPSTSGQAHVHLTTNGKTTPHHA